MESSEQFSLRLDTWRNRTSLADYTQEEQDRNERLISETNLNRQILSPELRHYQILRGLASKK